MFYFSDNDNELIAELQRLLKARNGRQSGEFDEFISIKSAKQIGIGNFSIGTKLEPTGQSTAR